MILPAMPTGRANARPMTGSASCEDASRRAEGHTKLAFRRLLHRLFQARFRRTGPQRLWLAFMRRPAGQPDHIEGGADAAVSVGEALAVDLRHPQQSGAASRCPPALDQNVG